MPKTATKNYSLFEFTIQIQTRSVWHRLEDEIKWEGIFEILLPLAHKTLVVAYSKVYEKNRKIMSNMMSIMLSHEIKRQELHTMHKKIFLFPERLFGLYFQLLYGFSYLFLLQTCSLCNSEQKAIAYSTTANVSVIRIAWNIFQGL